MQKTILLTGATDGIGRVTAHMLAAHGHTLLLHGRNSAKLDSVEEELKAIDGALNVEKYVADLSRLDDVVELAAQVGARHTHIDALINNAGVFAMNNPMTADGLDARFVVNTIAPYLLTRKLMPLMDSTSRVVNLSSAAQFPVDLRAFKGHSGLSDGAAYAQSKLGLTMWSRSLALELGDRGPVIIAVNPASMLGSKMVKQAYGVAGGDLRIGADILCRAALDDEFSDASGLYFDNDSKRFASPHPDALNKHKCADLLEAMDTTISKILAA